MWLKQVRCLYLAPGPRRSGGGFVLPPGVERARDSPTEQRLPGRTRPPVPRNGQHFGGTMCAYPDTCTCHPDPVPQLVPIDMSDQQAETD